jgi:predicted nucleic acid-binding Zn ribbon protein
MLGLGMTVTYSYRCLHCRYEGEVEDIVVDGFAAMSGLRAGRMPRLVCPACGGSFRALTDREHSER